MSIWHLIILLVVVVLLFGTGKLSKIGPDLGAAIRGFKKSMNGEDELQAKPVQPETLRADPPAAESAAHKQHDDAQGK
ncbi:MAG: twin-arginine translocase TatA/TatE family subunit [Rhodanobacter sp.]